MACALDLDNVTYYIGHETIMSRTARHALPRAVEAIYAFLQRNSLHLSDYFKLPADKVVEIGRQC